MTTTPNQSYLLSFYLRGPYPIYEPAPYSITVTWNYAVVGSFTVDSYSTGWVYESLTITNGSGSQGRLEFQDQFPSDVALDDISLVPIPVPEPSTAASFILGAAIGWALICRRLPLPLNPAR